jgi:hypothetical protein
MFADLRFDTIEAIAVLVPIVAAAIASIIAAIKATGANTSAKEASSQISDGGSIINGVRQITNQSTSFDKIMANHDVILSKLNSIQSSGDINAKVNTQAAITNPITSNESAPK